MKKVFDLLTILKMSCEEGLSGDWDCSTEEGKESFVKGVFKGGCL